ncbi:MAG: hypothetical protein ACRC8A_14535 [Microcoleaceae cyanobacterium]
MSINWTKQRLTLSFLTVGFTDETVIDGVGDDIFINLGSLTQEQYYRPDFLASAPRRSLN